MVVIKSLVIKAIDYFQKWAKNRFYSTYLLGAYWQMKLKAVLQVDYLQFYFS